MFKSFEGENRNKIEKFEEELGFSLPSDYKKFLSETNGGVFEGLNHRFTILETEQIEMDVLFGFNSNRSLDLVQWKKEFGDELPEYAVLIGNSLEAGLILLVTEGNYSGIYLWDDSLVLPDSTEEECLYRITDDFDSFICQVLQH